LLGDVLPLLAPTPVDPLPVGAAVVQVPPAVRLGLGIERDPATAVGVAAGERERALRERPLVLHLGVARVLTEGLLKPLPLGRGVDGGVAGVVRDAPPGELRYQAVARISQSRVEVLPHVTVDDVRPVCGDEPRRDKAFFEAPFPDHLEREAAEVQLHLAAHQDPPLLGRSCDGSASPLRPSLLVERGHLAVEYRRPTWVPTPVAPLDHPVDGLASTGAVALGLR